MAQMRAGTATAEPPHVVHIGPPGTPGAEARRRWACGPRCSRRAHTHEFTAAEYLKLLRDRVPAVEEA